MKFYVCPHCKNLVRMINDSQATPVCCGEAMKELIPCTVEASFEKHIPVPSVEGNTVKVKVGSAEHPMAEAHYIVWIALETCCGTQMKFLKPGDAPSAEFVLAGNQKPVSVYAYCNLHGLWKADI